MRRLFPVLAAVFFVSVLSAQEFRGENENVSAAGIFPLALVLEGVDYAGSARVWRPDWPLELPPDAFTVRAGEVSRIKIDTGKYLLDFRYGTGGKVEEFPFVIHGRMAQISLVYDEAPDDFSGGEFFSGREPPQAAGDLPEGSDVPQADLPSVDYLPQTDYVPAAGWDPPPVIREMTVVFPPLEPEPEEAAGEDAPLPETALPEAAPENAAPVEDEPWKLEFLEYRGFFPALVRASCGDAWYFIYLAGGVSEIRETWYDAAGTFLGAYRYSLTEIDTVRRIRAVEGLFAPEQGTDFFDTEFYYDSRGFLTEASGSDGFFRVLYYLEDRPRYWERRPAVPPETEIPDTAGATPAGTTPADTSAAGAEDSSLTRNPSETGIFSLQWDERGLIVRVRGDLREQDNGNGHVDYRYEYTLDERGNWIERREIPMGRTLGLLVPARGTVLTRVLEYGSPR